MAEERTQFQDDDQQRRSRELSRQRTQPPIQVPGYETRQFLGAGAYGEVWVALDENTGRKVAIKFYTQKSGVDWSNLSREVEKLVFLSADRYVVQLLDVGWDSQPPYYVMEYVDGGSLQQLLESQGPLPVGEAVEMFREIVTGLLHAHGKGVLHCDLKPDNILLDQDQMPRLADFGQSRLSHEQTPALGTLFYMAPEQADLDAVPDARWDVYGLGALLHTMITGSAPHRCESLLDEIDADATLIGRLSKYREQIHNAPVPTAHRKVPGVDRELADIVDRCLAVNPERRFPNVQSVLTAIRQRDQIRDRRPLLLMGLLGPLLFLLVLGIFGSKAYRKSVEESGQMVRAWAQESSRFAAKFVAEAVARRIDFYFRHVEREAADPDLQETVLAMERELADVMQGLVDTSKTVAERDALREEFLSHPLQRDLQQRMGRLIQESEGHVASWFITNAQGLQLASGFVDSPSHSTVGRDYSRRSYYHGRGEDLEDGQHYGHLGPLAQTQLSSVFKSEATGTWKVAMSTPIEIGQRRVGVMALTVELGRLGDREEFSTTADRFVTLVDGRDGAHFGQVLQHPLFNEILSRRAKQGMQPTLTDMDFGDEKYRVKIDSVPDSSDPREDVLLYRDPMGKAPGGEAYDKDWIAAREQVRLEHQGNGGTQDTGLIVLVQEDYNTAAAPVQTLGNGLKRDAIYAFLIVLGGVFYLWYLVTRAIRDPNEVLRRSGGLTVRPSSLHSMDTVEIPKKLREKSS